MAEVLAVVASGMGVVSLAIQVAENIEKLKSFCDLLKTAPEEVRLAIEEVEILSLILEDIDGSVQQQLLLSPSIKVAVMKSLRLCRASGEALGVLAREMEDCILLSKKRGALKVALKKDKMDFFRRKLENARATFLLAHHCYSQAIQQQKWESHERDMTEMRSLLSGLRKSPVQNGMRLKSMGKASEKSESETEGVLDSWKASANGSQISNCSSQVVRLSGKNVVAAQSGFSTVFGMINLVKENRKSGTTSSIYLGFPQWLYARRFEIRIRNSYMGWDQSFRSYRVKDYDSDVFYYSMTGDIKGLQHIFDTGEASPFEVDPEGRTPLHYAAMCARAATCRFLLENGADANVRTCWEGTFNADDVTRSSERIRFAMNRCVSVWSPPLSLYSTPLHLLAGVAKDYIDISKGARKGGEVAQKLIGSGRSIELEIQATAEALVSFGQSDPFHKDQYGNTVYHILDGSTTPWRWLQQQNDIQLANMTHEEIRDILFARCLELRDHELNNLRGILPEGDRLHQLAASGSEESEFGTLLVLIGMSLTMRTLFDKNIRKNWKSLSEVERYNIIPELVAAGSDIHCLQREDGEEWTMLTALLYIALTFRDFTIVPIRNLNPDFDMWEVQVSRHGVPLPVMLGWLSPLAAAGVDLVAYGEEERAIHKRGEATWTIVLTNDHEDGLPYHLTYEILDIRPAALPEDFHIEWEDLYVSSALAEDFWRLVEGDADVPPNMPGSWAD